MSLGDVFRQAREQYGLSQREMATRAGVTASLICRLEQGRTSPSWRTIEVLAAALQRRAQLRLVPDQAAVDAAGALVRDSKPIDRLRAQELNVLGTIASLVHFNVPFVLAGTVAALLQGFPTPVDDIHILVHDTDEAMTALEGLLIAEQLLFDEMEPGRLRKTVQRSWAIGECDVRITLVDKLPDSLTVELLTDFEVQVLPPEALLGDEEVASMLGVVQVRSSDL